MDKVIREQAKILTVEELKEIETLYNCLFPRLNEDFPNVVKLINSHRLLLEANAELSFKNMKYKEALNSIVNGNWSSRLSREQLEIWQTDRINPKQIALEALEDLK